MDTKNYYYYYYYFRTYISRSLDTKYVVGCGFIGLASKLIRPVKNKVECIYSKQQWQLVNV